MRTMVFDVETTGLTMPSVADVDKQPRIIELAFVLIDDGAIVDEQSWLIDPQQQITAEITKITGITNEMLVGKPFFKELASLVSGYLKDVQQLIAHNAPFDCACLQYEFKRADMTNFYWPANVICTVQEFHHELGRRLKLTELYERKLGKPLLQTHRALDDVHALAEIVIKEGLA